MTKAELKKLAAGHLRWVERLKASGRKFTQCHCPECAGIIELLRPVTGERDYTSVIRCPHCGAMFYHRTSADGAVRITPMES